MGGSRTDTLTSAQLDKLSGWLAFIRHAQTCLSPTCSAFNGRCLEGKGLVRHLLYCANPHCTHRHCQNAKQLLRHHFECSNRACRVCSPVVDYYSQLSALAIFES